MSLGQRIQAALQRSKLTQSSLAAQVGVSQSYISNLVAGRKTAPSPEVVRGLALALQLPAAELFAAAGLVSPPPQQSFVVAVTGASGSGKTWFANQLRNLNPHGVTILSQDRYYKPQAEVEQLTYAWDDPDALAFDEMLEDLIKLKAGEPRLVPTYDFTRHERAAAELIQPAPLLVLEGHLVCYLASVRDALDAVVWIQVDEYQLLRRRLQRDCTERGRHWQEVLEVFDKVVRPASQRYVFPCRSFADVELDNNRDNPQATPLLAKTLMGYVQGLQRTDLS